jgi:Fe-S-cluster-containing hydrogenase component 2
LSVEQREKGYTTVPCPWMCGVCSAVCQVSAIDYVDDNVRVDRSLCSRCMICTMVCPVGILEEAHFVRV